MRWLFGSFLVAAMLALTGCGDAGVTGCTRELRVQFSPTETTILVGQSFIASVALSSCGGREQVADVFVWQALDSAIVAVDSSSGLVTGRAPGATGVKATGAYYGSVGSLQVLVLPSAP